MHHLPLAPEGLVYILASLILAVLLYLLWPWLVLPGLILALFMVFFFRNPRREGPEQPNDLLSPADGRVMAVTAEEHADFIQGPALRITIFLSLFNVHINRSPMTGEIAWIHYRPGHFLPAFKSHASDLNERNAIGIRQGDRQIIVHQITGFVARRIVCDVQTGDQVTQRQRFGMIRFGSCTELICPADARIQVKPGDKVKGGKTVLATFAAGEEV